MNSAISKFAISVTALALAALLLMNLEPSSSPNAWRYSYLKLIFLGTIATGIIYLVYSLCSVRLQRINALVIYGIVSNVLLLEIAFQLFPSLIPQTMLLILQAEDRRIIAEQRGLFTKNRFQGDGMFYSYRAAGRPLKKFPWVKVDADGFRNPNVPQRAVDVVYFGDSVAFARHAEKDLGARFHERGIHTYSLAMGGNGPGQYRDAYRKYVVERRLAHRLRRHTSVHCKPISTTPRSTPRSSAKAGDYRGLPGSQHHNWSRMARPPADSNSGHRDSPAGVIAAQVDKPLSSYQSVLRREDQGRISLCDLPDHGPCY